MSETPILMETIEHVGLIRLNRPQALNALNRALMTDLAAALDSLENNPAIRAIVLTGNERAFAAGADIKELVDLSAVDMFAGDFFDRPSRVAQTRKPMIAAVSGFALGGGFELALSCDMIVASETARFGLPEITLGIIPGWGGTQRLTRIVGKNLAMEMILNNRTLTAPEAEKYGLVNRIVPVESYLQEALKLASEIAARAPLAAILAKQAILMAEQQGIQDGLASEQKLFGLAYATQDHKEGMIAFIEKRKAAWQGK